MRIETRADIEALERQRSLFEEELDQPMREDSWSMAWECVASPTARAYRLLEKLDLGALRTRAGKSEWRNALEFIESFHPGDSSRVVFAEDPVTASLLQARLTELGAGLRLVTGRAS